MRRTGAGLVIVVVILLAAVLGGWSWAGSRQAPTERQAGWFWDGSSGSRSAPADFARSGLSGSSATADIPTGLCGECASYRDQLRLSPRSARPGARDERCPATGRRHHGDPSL